MSDILETAKAHFREQVSGELGQVDVPEWGTTIYFRPASLRDLERVVRLQRENRMMESLVESIIVRALDADGKPMFKLANKIELMRSVDPDVVVRICNAMGDDLVSVSTAEKN
ncbi:MAG: hypothetical protein ACE5FN_12140 [Leptospirillia bacterium]